ncbi:metallophosphoesterase [Nonomuraea sp. NBC_01738]|uniref:metallophosphoesterase n=1 Tax=Nonomuraea sp. NBC_01738 TaxID=2976003 RepID=UPI002E0E91B0|nr:metallophosphoesterase [Nonomuraea sp. NBC_01738]
MVFGFVGMMIALVIGVHYYLWQRLVRATTVPGRLRRVLTWVLVGLAVLVMATFVVSRMAAGAWYLAWPGYTWFALMFYLVVFLAVLEVPRAVLLWRSRRAAARAEPAAETASAEPAGSGVATTVAAPAVAAPALSRRLFIGRATALTAGVAAIGTVGYGMRTALGPPVIEPVKVLLPGLDSRLSGLRFAVVSDIHLGPLTGLNHTQRIVRMINELRPDVVAIVGDLVDGTVAELGALAKPLKGLESRYGAYFVTGNHEYYTANGPNEWIEELDQLGVKSLRNQRVEIEHQGAVLDLAGVNDVNGTTMDDGPDFDRALGGRDTTRSTVLLAHQPVQVHEAAKYGVDLQLSGHTHGGQIAPFDLVVPLQQPVVSGLETVDGVQVYVTRGAGFWGPPVRVGAPPEITLLEL